MCYLHPAFVVVLIFVSQDPETLILSSFLPFFGDLYSCCHNFHQKWGGFNTCINICFNITHFFFVDTPTACLRQSSKREISVFSCHACILHDIIYTFSVFGLVRIFVKNTVIGQNS